MAEAGGAGIDEVIPIFRCSVDSFHAKTFWWGR
jgi:hypothetical protein